MRRLKFIVTSQQKDCEDIELNHALFCDCAVSGVRGAARPREPRRHDSRQHHRGPRHQVPWHYSLVKYTIRSIVCEASCHSVTQSLGHSVILSFLLFQHAH